MPGFELVKGRREVLLGGGIAAATLLAPPLAASSTQYNRSRSAGSDMYDVIVVGGGFAGLTAARDCAKRGMKTLLLEARGRVGGRTLQGVFKDHEIELGGTWVHWTQPHVWAEISRYGLTLIETPGAMPHSITWRSDDRAVTRDGMSAFGLLIEGMNKFYDIDGFSGRTVYPKPAEPLLKLDLVRKYDEMNLTQRLMSVDLDPLIKDLIAPQYTINVNRDPSTGSFAEQLHWWACGDFNVQSLLDRCGHYRISEGTGGLARAIRQDGDFELRMNSPVTSIAQSRGLASVKTGDRLYRAGAVICAVPVNTLRNIRFAPGLSVTKSEAARVGVAGTGNKLYVHIKEKVGAWMGCAPHPYPITLAFTEQERDDGTVIVCFDTAGALNPNDQSGVQTAIGGLIPGAQVTAVMSYPWRQDPYSNGAWAFYRPGQLSNSWSELRRPEGNVFFATADNASLWCGFIDGAIERGAHTAYEVFNALNKSA